MLDKSIIMWLEKPIFQCNITQSHNLHIWLKKSVCLHVAQFCRLLSKSNWLLWYRYYYPDLTHSTEIFCWLTINTQFNSKSNVFICRHFDHVHNTECVQRKLSLHNSAISPKQIICQLLCNQRMVSKTISRYQHSRYDLDSPRSGRPRATAARNKTYQKNIVQKWRHLTNRTILAEWQPTLMHEVFVSTV